MVQLPNLSEVLFRYMYRAWVSRLGNRTPFLTPFNYCKASNGLVVIVVTPGFTDLSVASTVEILLQRIFPNNYMYYLRRTKM